MGSAEFGWESLLHTDAPAACSLQAALFTTYDRPDDRLFAEHLLPFLLKLDRGPHDGGAERQYFLLELDERLKQLHDRLVVVSSTARDERGAAEEGESGSYGWIWRSIRQLTVGRHGKAVQHAKLWMFHWRAAGTNGAEYLEIVVSSANLTGAAFRRQLQGAWRACVELQPRGSAARLARWGVLPDFLQELARQAGDAERLVPFVKLLARAGCPEGVSFVASVPGTYSRQELGRASWGAAGLREIMPPGRGTVRVAILSPFIGSWNADALRGWCATFKGSPDRLELVWIDRHHPWVERWLLPEATWRTLTQTGATLLRLRHEPNNRDETDPFHEEHRPEDDRWGHAKAYLLQRGTSRRVLVTSANFSPAAWGRRNGDGGLTIENFELGVCVEQAAWPFGELMAFDTGQNAATEPAQPTRDAALITWARAVWDGTRVDIDFRCEVGRQLVGTLEGRAEPTTITGWTADAEGHLRSAHVPWADSERPPSLARLTCEQQTVIAAVFDERPMRDRENTVPPEVDPDASQAMRDELLFEQYGGRVASDGED